jgi:hypothetical protein
MEFAPHKPGLGSAARKLAEQNWLTCPKCRVRLKHLDRHLRKKHPRRRPRKPVPRTERSARQTGSGSFGPRFITCEFCDASMAAGAYRSHVQRMHPGHPVRHRPALGAGVQAHGLNQAHKDAISRLSVPPYRQRYRPRLRFAQGGAPGLGRRGR